MDELFLVGDIFDLWISDRPYFTHRYREVTEKLRLLKDAGAKIYYFEGNHDLDLERFWQRQLGFVVHAGPARFAINGVNYLVEHGDETDPADRGYRFLRWLLRTPVLIWLQRHLPNAFVQRIGERASRTSRGYTTQVKTVTDTQVRAQLHTHLVKNFRKEPFDVFIAGHVHVREDTLVDVDGHQVRCVNLGTWLKEPLVGVVSGGEFSLRAVADVIGERD